MLAIAVPLVLSNMTVPLVGVADTAVIGRLNDPVLIGGVSLGSTIFAMAFWAFGFLRMGTTGLTAQAAGAGDKGEVAAQLLRALLIAATIGVILFIFHAPALVLTLKLIGGSDSLRTATADYFGIRILSAPATLANYALAGWFIGRGRTALAFLLQLFLNLLNFALAVILVLLAHKGVKGVAAASVLAEYAALVLGLGTAWRFLALPAKERGAIFDASALKRLLTVNGDIMIRTVCLMFAFTFFAAQGAKLGDVALAANSILRSLSDVSVYVLDGFAFAAEVLAGQAAGAESRERFRHAVYLSSLWAGMLAFLLGLGLWAGGNALIDFITATPSVQEAARAFLPWAVLTPVIGVACFQLDGVFIGTTRTADMRNMMIVSLGVFLGAWAVLTPSFGNHGLWASLMVFFVARAVTLGWCYPALERSIGKGALSIKTRRSHDL